MAYEISYITDFTGGENTVSAPDQLLPNQVLAAENVDLPLRGGFTKRKGNTPITEDFPHGVVRLVYFEYLSGTSRLAKVLALCDDGKMYLQSDPDAVVYDWGNAYHVDYEVYRNKCYLIGGGKFVEWDGSTFTTVTNVATDTNHTTIAKCQLIEQRGERLFASGNAEEPNTLYYSEIAQPTYWKTASFINAVTDDNDTITAIKEFFEALVVFKTRSIYAWSGWDPTDDVTFNRLATSMGTRAYRSVHYVGSNLVYLGDDGLYALKGTYKNVIVTERLTPYHTPEFKSIYRTSGVPMFYNPTHACVHDGKYLLSTVQGATLVANSDVLVLNIDALDTGAVQVTTYKGWACTTWLPLPDGTLLGGQGTSILQYQTGYNDSDLAYTLRVRTAPQAQGEPIKRKKYRYAYVWMRQYEEELSSMHVSAYIDYRDTGSDVDPDESGVWDKDESTYDVTKFDFVDLVTRKLSVKNRGKRLIFEFTDSSVDQLLHVYGIGVEYRVKKPEKV